MMVARTIIATVATKTTNNGCPIVAAGATTTKDTLLLWKRGHPSSWPWHQHWNDEEIVNIIVPLVVGGCCCLFHALVVPLLYVVVLKWVGSCHLDIFHNIF